MLLVNEKPEIDLDEYFDDDLSTPIEECNRIDYEDSFDYM